MASPVTYGGAATRAGKLTSRIPQIIADLDDKALEGVVEVAERIVERAKERVPVDEGDLRDAIHIEMGADLVGSTDGKYGSAEDLGRGAVAVVAGNHDVFYGHIVENGGARTPARPFLVPAYEAERENLHRVVGEKLGDL